MLRRQLHLQPKPSPDLHRGCLQEALLALVSPQCPRTATKRLTFTHSRPAPQQYSKSSLIHIVQQDTNRYAAEEKQAYCPNCVRAGYR